MEFRKNPQENIGDASIWLPTSTCKCASEDVNCAWSVPVTLADYQGITVNGVTTAGTATTAQELTDSVLAGLIAAGAKNYNSSNLSYDGTDLIFNEASTLLPVIILAGVDTNVTQLCNKTVYNTYQGAGLANAIVQVDGVVATEATHDAAEDEWTIIAPQGAVVTITSFGGTPAIDGVLASDCGLYENRYTI